MYLVLQLKNLGSHLALTSRHLGLCFQLPKMDILASIWLQVMIVVLILCCIFYVWHLCVEVCHCDQGTNPNSSPSQNIYTGDHPPTYDQACVQTTD